LSSNQVTEDGMSLLPEMNMGDLSAQENEIRPKTLIREENQHVNEVRPYSPVLKNVVSPHVQDPTPQRDSWSDSPHTQGLTPLRDRERDAMDSGSYSPHA